MTVSLKSFSLIGNPLLYQNSSLYIILTFCKPGYFVFSTKPDLVKPDQVIAGQTVVWLEYHVLDWTAVTVLSNLFYKYKQQVVYRRHQPGGQ